MKNIAWENNNLKEILDRKDIKQEELAEYLGLSQNTVSQYVNAKREPKLKIICKICEYLKIENIEDLFK